jgi:hypothetical protein
MPTPVMPDGSTEFHRWVFAENCYRSLLKLVLESNFVRAVTTYGMVAEAAWH